MQCQCIAFLDDIDDHFSSLDVSICRQRGRVCPFFSLCQETWRLWGVLCIVNLRFTYAFYVAESYCKTLIMISDQIRGHCSFWNQLYYVKFHKKSSLQKTSLSTPFRPISRPKRFNFERGGTTTTTLLSSSFLPNLAPLLISRPSRSHHPT